MTLIRAGVIAVLMAFGGSVEAQTLKDVDQKEAELVAAWEKSPLFVRNALLVTDKPPVYGAYTVRPSNVYKRGETIYAYMEPIGYTWKVQPPDDYVIGITVDFVVKGKDGKIIGGQEKFLNYTQNSHRKIRELMLNVSLSLGNLAAGEYVVEYIVHDIADKTARVDLPFVIAE